MECELAYIHDVPLYNQDLETEYPEPVARIKEKIKIADGILIATPEYGRSVPGVLKNLIDWTSRPSGASAWKDKPVYVIGASDGSIGTAVAQKEVRADVGVAGAIPLYNPEFYLGGFKKKIDEAGKLIDPITLEHIDNALVAFLAFVEKLRGQH